MRLISVAVTLGLLAGCTKDAAKPAEPAKAPTKEYRAEALKLSFSMPADVQVAEPMDILGNFVFQCCGGAAIQINLVKPESMVAPKSLEDAKRSTADFENVRVTRAEATADGWRVEYDHDTALGRSFKVDVRRTWGGAEFDCEASGNDAAKALLAAKACESLVDSGPAVAKPPAR